jgi:GAF domain-containing protein
MESVAGVPLMTEGRCVGALSLMADQADAWSGVPPILLEEIAASIAVAIDHCGAYEELGRRRDEQAALLEINRAVARHLHRDELFGTLAECLRDLLPSDRFGIELPVAGDKLRAYVLATRNATSARSKSRNCHRRGPPAAGPRKPGSGSSRLRRRSCANGSRSPSM